MGYEGEIGASVILYRGENVIKTLRYYLGMDKCHTVYGAEGVGVSMDLHLLTSLGNKVGDMVIMGMDSQALIKATKNQHTHTQNTIFWTRFMMQQKSYMQNKMGRSTGRNICR